MTSFFSGWSAHEIIGPLNKSEVRAALLEYTIEKSHFRTWNSIESFVLSSCDEIKNVLYEAGMAKAKVEEDHRNVLLEIKILWSDLETPLLRSYGKNVGNAEGYA